MSLHTRTVALRDAVDAALTAAGTPVLRAFVAPGTTAAWDTCCDSGVGEGQAWVAVERVYPSSKMFPGEDVDAPPCGPTELAARLHVGVLRCAHTVDDRGRAPTGAEITGDAAKTASDRDTVLNAIVCDWLAGADRGSWSLGGWEPLGPEGGCVGGMWRVTVTVPFCNC